MTVPPAAPAPSLRSLFAAFLKLGAVSFGGPAIVAYIRRMVVEQKGWLDAETFAAGNALCQALPGAISVQMAVYVGLKLKGLRGALVSFAGYVSPAFLFMLLGSGLYTRTHAIPVVASAFSGLRAIIIALLAGAALDFARTYLKNWGAVLIAFSAACLLGCKVNPVLVIAGAGLAGLFLCEKNAALQAVPRSQRWAEPSRTMQLFFLVLCVALGFTGLYFTDRQLFDLGLLMSKIDLFAFGGGYTSVPLMFHEVVEVRSWLDGQTLLDGIALGQVTPGPIVLTATFVGYVLKGLSGAVVGTVCVLLPSVLLLIGIVPYFDKLKNIPRFTKIMEGILCSFVGLIVSVTVLFGMRIPWDLPRSLLAGAAFIALLLKVELVWVVCAGTLISVLFL